MTAEDFKRLYSHLFLPRPVHDPEVDRRFDEAREPQLRMDLKDPTKGQ